MNASWRKSTYSGGGGGDCLEFADNIPGTVPVRDSKNPTGPALHFPPTAWSAFIDDVVRVVRDPDSHTPVNRPPAAHAAL
ncbi:DUF397 domain-containing protein [Streptomyces flavofungini]|uniref:DUF397 domain-containing protein n=1 Tax=Streptomyces flavofungini TaxID=68200 RepID=A0ABS0XDW4_9ACTN|nr:DUF397 domain-containing protein [Streptomyces flavofungini]MBJ3811397.1 DUF397 domain-containing protein [Streptomyces flavofungini]GHC42607.1 hypothetical protein GCM10010349_03500 [Streptomyces flavofungini]